MTKISSWSRVKYPEERDVRYAFFQGDVPAGETISNATATVETGDIVVESILWDGTKVTLILTGGTKNSVIKITVTTNTGKILVGKVHQQMDGPG